MPPSGDALPPLTAADAATELTRLAGAFAEAFTALASAAAAPGAAPGRRLALAEASRLVGAHALALAALVPESVLLADARAAGVVAPLALPDDPGALLAALDDALGAVCRRATPVADAAFVRVAAAVAHDLGALRPRLG